jgi:hypothetical protein
MLDLADPARADDLPLLEWSAAEVLDAPFADDQTLRAMVCRLGAHRWQWSVCSLDSDRGELISVGIEKTAAAARQTATVEIAKCLEDAIS